MHRLLIVLSAAASLVAADAEYTPDLPKTAEKYEAAKNTQRIAQISTNGGPFLRHTDPVKIADMANTDWHQSGGMRGIGGVTSTKYRTVKATYAYGVIQVMNEHGNLQPEYGIVREYPDGARFDDVLSYQGKVFEHRVRTKTGGAWSSRVAYKDQASYPPGYTGLKKTCAECHDRAGAGAYGADGLVPGGDGVFSDPLDWTVVPGYAVGDFGKPAAPATKTIEQTVRAADGSVFKRNVVVPADYVVGSGAGKNPN